MKKYIYVLFKLDGTIENITPHLTSTEMRERQARRYFRTYCDGYLPNSIVMSRFIQYKDLTYNIHNFVPEKEFFNPNKFIKDCINRGKWVKLEGEDLENLKVRLEDMTLFKVGDKIDRKASRGRHSKRGGKK